MASARSVRLLGIDGSPAGSGRTATALDAVLKAAADAGGEILGVVSLASASSEQSLEAIHEAEAFVFGSPVYRASIASPLKALLDELPRARWGETTAPITARAVAMVITGATWHHYLALDDLRGVLAGFFAAHVLTPGLYVPAVGFDETGSLQEPFLGQADNQGRSLYELAVAVSLSEHLSSVTPQV